MELGLPWAAEKPHQVERCEPICLAEVLPVSGREAEQVMAALTQRRRSVFQQAANLKLRSGSSATGGDKPSPGRCGRLMGLGSKWCICEALNVALVL